MFSIQFYFQLKGDFEVRDECLLQLYEVLLPEARRGFDVLAQRGAATMEELMRSGPLTTQQARKALWGLASTGLVVHQRGLPVRLSTSGERLAELLKATVAR